MWIIENLTSPPATAAPYMSDGEPIVGTRRGPEGASFRLYAPGCGMLDITDTGHQPGGPHYWQLVINGQIYWYDGDGSPSISVTTDGTFAVTGDGNDIGGYLLGFPDVDPSDLEVVDMMQKIGLIPYGQLQPHERHYSAVEGTAQQYLGFSPDWYDLGLTVYDWTSADFYRMDLFHLFRYVDVAGMPLDDNDIIDAIWSSNWPPYTPQDAPFMASFMMKPASTKDEVASQYAAIKDTLVGYLDALMRVTTSAMYAMPRTSVGSIPMLYSGQVAISNLGETAMATYFNEYPGNAGPVGQPMGMPIAEALNGFMAPQSNVTLKTFISFTDSESDAQHYSNGIILEMSPQAGAAVWPQCAYVTPLSNGPTKVEYTYLPGSTWLVTGWRTDTIDGKQYTVISLTDNP